MKTQIFRSTILVSALMLGACSSMPTSTPMLDQAHSDFMAASANFQVGKYAPLALKDAGMALAEADAAAKNNESKEQVDKLAYLAKQKIATAEQVAKQKVAEAAIAQAAEQRDQIQLAARTAEAERANKDAAAAQALALVAQAQGADAQRQAESAEERTRAAQAKAAQLEAMLADLEAKKTERGMIVTIGDVLFASGQATLMESGMSTLRKLADVLNKNQERTVLVEGFTDSVGSDAYNQALSERRAAAVRAALLGMGIMSDRVATRGYGEAYPVAPNDSTANRQLNRRVDIVFSDGAEPIHARR